MSSTRPDLELARTRLTDLRHGLLRLHKALLDSERLTYERVHGRIASPGAFFQLVIGDAWFEWLHRVSELVVTGGGKHVGDHLAFQVLHGVLQRNRGGDGRLRFASRGFRHALWEVLFADDPFAGAGDQALDLVFELPHVSRPGGRFHTL